MRDVITPLLKVSGPTLACLVAIPAFALFPGSASGLPALFPASGIALAAILLCERRLRLPLSCLMFAACATGFLVAGLPWPQALAFAALTMVEVLASTWLLEARGRREHRFASAEEIAALMGGAIVVVAVVAVAAALVAGAGRGDFLLAWLAWGTSHGVGILTCAPPIVLGVRRLTHGATRSTKAPRVWPLFVAIWLAAAWLSFNGSSILPGFSVDPYLMVVLFAWSGWYLSLEANSLLVIGLGVLGLSSGSVLAGPSPLGGDSLPERIIALQAFVGVVAIVVYLIASGYARQRDITREVEDERARVSGILDRIVEGIFVTDSRGRFSEINPAGTALIGYGRDELFSLGIADLLHPSERAEFEQVRLTPGGVPDVTTRRQLRNRDGRWVDVEIRARTFPDGHIEGAVRDITEALAHEAEMERAVAEKEALLRELYHRSNNNMQVVSALLEFQAIALGDQRFDAAIADTQSRISSMGLVNRMLYEAADLSHIELGAYVEGISRIIARRYRREDNPIALEIRADDLSVLIDTAIPCGLILTELISNVYRHAYPEGSEGAAAVTLRKSADGRITLRVADDGRGVAPGFDAFTQGGMGLQNVIGLARNQLRGELRFETASGFACEITFKDDLYTARI